MFKWYYYLLALVFTIGGYCCSMFSDISIPKGCADAPATYGYIKELSQYLGGLMMFLCGAVLWCLTFINKEGK